MLIVDDWIDELRARGRSGYTARAYRWHVKNLLAELNKDVRAIEARDLRGYIARKRDLGWADSTIKLTLDAARSFFAHAVGRSKSPAKAVTVPRPKMKPGRTLSAAQAAAVMASCETSTPTGQRDLALLCLMLDTGLRSLEVCRLELGWMQLAERRFMALVKGGRWQPKVYSVYTASQLERWLAVRADVVRPGVENLFCSVGGLKPGTPLTTHGLRCVFRYIARRAGMEKFSPHDMRRSFATLTIRFGASTRLVQEQGGWEDLSLVERYTQVLKAEDAEPYLPVGRLMGL